jgi:hypothetical protein
MFLVRKPEGKRPLGRPNFGWEDGIRLDCGEEGWKSVDQMYLAWGRDWW